MARSYLPSPFNRDRDPFNSLFREVERVFDDFSMSPALSASPSMALNPKIDVSESGDAVDIKAELPGVAENDIDIRASNGMLTISGEKKVERDEKDKHWHFVERGYGRFVRSIPLSFDPDPSKVEASFDNGVLTIHLPKPADLAKREKRIEIRKSGSKTSH